MTKKTWIDNDIATTTELNRIEDQLLVICTSGSRPTGVDGQFIYETDTGRRYHYDGSSWVGRTDEGWTAYTPSWNNVTVGNGTNTGRYRYVEGLVFYEASLVWGSTTAITGNVSVDHPVTAGSTPERTSIEAAATTPSGAIPVVFEAPNTTRTGIFRALNSSGTYVASTRFSATVPVTWTTGAEWYVSGWIEG